MSVTTLPSTHKSANDLDTDWNFDGGDISITYTLGGKILTGKVSSHAMILASPVWKKFIHPPWRQRFDFRSVAEQEANKQSLKQDLATDYKSEAPSTSVEKHIDFSEDDGWALLIILRIVHLRFGKVPELVSSAHLLEIAKLSDQYQIFAVLKPWLRSWIEDAEAEGYEVLGKERWLFIFWAFGKEVQFKNLANELVFESRSNKKNEYLTSKGEALQEPTPPQIIGKFYITFTLGIKTRASLQYITLLRRITCCCSPKTKKNDCEFQH